MNQRLARSGTYVLILLACLIGIWASGILTSDQHSRHPKQREGPPVTKQHEGPPVTRDGTETSHNETSRRPEWAAKRAALEGKVLIKETGRPPDTQVRIFFDTTEPTPLDVRASYETQSSDDGTFQIADLAYPAFYRIRCVASDIGIDHTETKLFGRGILALQLGLAAVREMKLPIRVTLLVEQHAILRGRVQGVAGNPIPGARVTVQLVRRIPHPRAPGRMKNVDHGGDASADADGLFTMKLPLLRPDEKPRVVASNLGFYVGEGAVTCAPPFECDAVITLEQSFTIEGLVLDGDGTAIEKAKVKILAVRTRQRSSPRAAGWANQQFGGDHAVGGPKESPEEQEMVGARYWTDSTGKFLGTPPAKGDVIYVAVLVPDRPPVIRELAGERRKGEKIDLGRIIVPMPPVPVTVQLRHPDGRLGKGLRVLFQSHALSQWAQLNSGKLEADDRGLVRSRFLEEGSTYTAYVYSRAGLFFGSIQDLVIRENMEIVLPDLRK